MKYFFLSLRILISAVACISSSVIAVTPTYKIRSQSRDKVRQVVGTAGNFTYLPGMERNWWGFLTATPECTQSFNPGNICQCLFGKSVTSPATTSNSNGCGSCDNSCAACSFLIQGGLVPDRNEGAWWADYFYLPLDFNSTISFSPQISNVIVDFDLYLGLDYWKEGMYCRIYGPFVHTRWDLNFKETVLNAGTNPGGNYQQGYMAPVEIDGTTMLPSFSAYASGQTRKPLYTPQTNSTITNDFIGLAFSKMTHCARIQNGFADLRMELGWNFWLEDDYHVGINIQGAAPTGNRMHAEWLFNPQIGNGHHWELGGGLTAHYVFWRSEDEEKHIGAYLDVNITHLFTSREHRTFDLVGKPMSRYMLAAQFGSNTQNLAGSTGTTAIRQFSGLYAPIANLSTLQVDVSIPAQVDLVAMLIVTAGNWSIDVGYNFWAQSCEKIDCNHDTCVCEGTGPTLCDADQANTWGLKGDARMYGFSLAGSGVAPLLAVDEAVPLSATNSTATIFSGTVGNNLDANGSGSDNDTPRGAVDNELLAQAGGAPSPLTVIPTNAIQISTSIQPVFLSCEDIDFKGVRGFSNKVFAHISYNFIRENWTPFIGIGAFGEFGSSDCDSSCSSCTTTNSSSCLSCCEDSCITCALSQWGVWLKAGVAFN